MCSGVAIVIYYVFRNMVNKLGQVLKLYWWEKMDRLGKTPRPLSPNPARGGRTRITQAPAQRMSCHTMQECSVSPNAFLANLSGADLSKHL